MVKENLKTRFDESYELILIGFMLQLKENNNSGKDIGRKLADLVDFMEAYNA